MTPQQFYEEMCRIGSVDGGYDPEAGHASADELMCRLLTELGYEEGVKVYQGLTRWYA